MHGQEDRPCGHSVVDGSLLYTATLAKTLETDMTTRAILATAILTATLLAPAHDAQARSSGAAVLGTGINKQESPVRVTRDHRGEARPVERSRPYPCRRLPFKGHGSPCIYR
jgi:hypothetical protein